MPSFDGGHYFLSVLIPVKTTADGPGQSHVHQLRTLLSGVPTALQSPANEHREINAPFARSPRTHLLRLLVVDNVAFNGRQGGDTLWSLLQGALGAKGRRGTKAAMNDVADQLPCPYLVLAADFDAQSGPDGEPRAYLRELWAAAGETLARILAHCDLIAPVHDADSFAAAIAACEVDTTMPFNDYWQTPPDFAKLGLPLLPRLIPAIVGGFILAFGLVAVAIGQTIGWVAALGGAAIVYLGLRYVYEAVMARGAQPLPPAPDSDLPSVLKALYLRQHFVQFAIDVQGATPAELHAAFGAFLARRRPLDTAQPTQPAGVVRAPS